MTTATASAKCTLRGIGDDFKFEGQPWCSGALELNVEAITTAITRLAAGLRAEVEARLDLEARVENIACRFEEAGSAIQEPASLIPCWTEDNKSDNTSTSKANANGGIPAPDLRGLELSWMQLQKNTEHLKQDLLYHKRQQDQKARAADEMLKLRFESLTRDIDSRVRIADLATHGDALLVQAKSVIECEGRVAAKAAISEDIAQLHSGLECVSSALEERQRLLEERFDNLPVSCPSTSPGTPSSAASTGLTGTDDVYLDAAPEKGSKGSQRSSLVGDALARPIDVQSVGWVQDQLTQLRAELALVAEQGREAITLVEGAGGSDRGCAPNSTIAMNQELNQHDELQGRALRQDIADVEDQLRNFRDEVHAKLAQLADAFVQPKTGSDVNAPTNDHVVCRTCEESSGRNDDSAANIVAAATSDAASIDSSKNAGLVAIGSLSTHHGQPSASSDQFAAWVEAQFATLRNEMAALADLSMQQHAKEKDAVTMDMVRQALRSQVGEPLGRLDGRVSDLESARPLAGAPAAALHEDIRKLSDRLNRIELRETHHPEDHADAFLKFQGAGGRNAEDGSRELANITHAVRGVQKDAERVSGKVDDLGAGLAALRGHVEAALPHLLSAMTEVAAHHGKAANVDGEAGSGAKMLPISLQAAHDACSGDYTRSPVFASREAHETLQKLQKAMEDEFRKQLAQLKEEMASQSNAGNDKLFQVNTRLQAAEKSLPVLGQQLWQMAQSKESFVENPSLTRVPLLEARCICCDRKAELMESKQGPWSQGGMPNTLWSQREPSCPAHHAAGPPRGYRQRRDHSLPAIDRAMSR